MSDQNAIALALRPGDEVTTTLGRKVIVGSVHRDEKHVSQWWIEPEGADDYTWWLPVSNIVQVNGRDPEILGRECTMSAVEKAIFRTHTAHWISKLKIADDTVIVFLHPISREDLLTCVKFARLANISIDRSYMSEAEKEFPWDIIGFDCEAIGRNRWKYCLHTDAAEYTFEADWPVVEFTSNRVPHSKRP